MRKFWNGRTRMVDDKVLQAMASALIPEKIESLELAKVKLQARWGNTWDISVFKFWKDSSITQEKIEAGSELWMLVMEHRRTYGIFEESTKEVHIPWYEFTLTLETVQLRGDCGYTYVGTPREELHYETLLIDLAEFPRDYHDLNEWFLDGLGLLKKNI